MIALLVVFGAASLLMPVARRALGGRIFVGAALVSAAACVWTALLGPRVLAGEPVVESVPWVPALDISITLRADTLSWLMALLVTGVGALVLLYCQRYFKGDDPSIGRFGAVLLAFAGVMYGLVLADDIYVMFVFWELTSVLSFLLIGHSAHRRASRGAAMQALLVTTLGGLAMLVGLVGLNIATGTTSLSAIVADPPEFTPGIIAAVLLVLAGAVSKSALLPFHFWLPGAMAAPTPVSAYLHAAAMVKAGIYLVARLAPGFADMPGWRETLVVLGIATMLVGGWRSLRQHDLKLILAYGTVSQLGFLTAVVGFGTWTTAYAGMAMLLAHACFKAALFLIVGMIDHRTGTRDIRKLSGLGRSAPVLLVVAIVAAASMAGFPPTFGFVAKEAVFTAFIEAGSEGMPMAWVALAGSVLGACLTIAYSLRFLYGAFASKPGVERVRYAPEHFDFMLSPLLLATLSLALGPLSPLLDEPLAQVADAFHAPTEDAYYHLALWHGFELALGLSGIAFLVGFLLFAVRRPFESLQARVPSWFDASRGYWWSLRAIDGLSARVTATTQRGSLPFYLATIFLVFVASAVFSISRVDAPPVPYSFEFDWVELAIVLLMAFAAFAVTRSQKRFQGVVLVGVTGYGAAATFALHGAPDLALTQALIETITLVVFVLVLRRLPARHGRIHKSMNPVLRWVIGLATGLAVASIAVIAFGNRLVPSDGRSFGELAVTGGHGYNFVNVTLVDIRGWDTMGELSVLVAAATGIASLIYLSQRSSGAMSEARAPKRGRWFSRERLESVTPRVEGSGRARAAAGLDHRRVWLLAGRTLAPENRSIVLEVVVRLVFHALLVTSLYLLFAGHNAPGGGFAGGVVAGLALAARYLAGGREELDQAVRIDAGRLLGIGLLMATLTALVPLFFGADPLTSTWIDEQVPFVGHVVFVSSTMFDIGVYLVVIALVIDILRSLGSQIDIQSEEDADPNDGLEEPDGGARPSRSLVAFLDGRDEGHGHERAADSDDTITMDAVTSAPSAEGAAGDAAFAPASAEPSERPATEGGARP